MEDALIRQVELFLYREARLLDERRFHEWLQLFTDDAKYWMPVRSNRYPKTSKAIAVRDRDKYDDEEVAKPDELAFYDETKASLRARIARLDTGMAWAEDPPSRTRHVISNVDAEPAGSDSELKAYSNFIVYRNRAEVDQEVYVGCRQDVLRQVDGTLKIARRKIVLDQNILLARNVSIFF